MAGLISTWAKSPNLKDKDVLIVSECLERIYPAAYEKISAGKEVLTACPEANEVVYGKLASILKSVKPRSITVLTVECSPHCYLLHAAVNEAFYITGSKIPHKHFICFEGELKEISPDAVRLARYLHLVDELLKKDKSVLEKLKKYSLECAAE